MRLLMRFRLRYLSNARRLYEVKLLSEIPQRSLAQIVNRILVVYGMWEKFEITTGAATDLLKLLASECCSVSEESSSTENDDDVLKRRVYAVLCKLRDNWRARVEEELADEEREH